MKTQKVYLHACVFIMQILGTILTLLSQLKWAPFRGTVDIRVGPLTSLVDEGAV